MRPSTRTSLGHLMRASRPVQSVTSSAVATAASAVEPGVAGVGLEPRGPQFGRRKEEDRHQDRRSRRRRPEPAPLAPARGLLLGKNDQAVVGQGCRRPSSHVVRATHAVPDGDPSPDGSRPQSVLDLVGAKSPCRSPVGRSQVGMTLDLEPEPRPGPRGRPRRARIPAEVDQGNELSARAAKSFEQSDVQRSGRAELTTWSRFRSSRDSRRAGRSSARAHDGAISRSSAMSSAGAEWVSTPTLIRSTPVRARSRTVSSVTPPEASSSIRGATASRAALPRPGLPGQGCPRG